MGEVRLGGTQSQSADYERVLDVVTAPVTDACDAQRVQSGFNARSVADTYEPFLKKLQPRGPGIPI